MKKLIQDLERGDVLEGKIIVVSDLRSPRETSEEAREAFITDRAQDDDPLPEDQTLVEFDMLAPGYDMHGLGYRGDTVEVTAQATGDILDYSGAFLATTAAMCLKIVNERTHRKGGSLVMVFGDVQIDVLIEGVDEAVQMQVNVKFEGVVLDFTDAAKTLLARSDLLREAAAALAAQATTQEQQDPLLGVQGPVL